MEEQGGSHCAQADRECAQYHVGNRGSAKSHCCKTGSKVKIIAVHDIHFIEADDDFVKVITAEGAYLKNKTMSFYEQTLDPLQFVRVHRSHIVQVNQITKIEPYQKESHLAILRDGTKIPVSKTGYTRLKEVLGI